MAKRSVLIQNHQNLDYDGLCNEGKFKMKKSINGEMHEVITIEKDENENFVLTKLPPLVSSESKNTYQWCEEALYHLYPEVTELTPEERKKIMKYFGEK
jgi:hypothetical protein